MHRYRILAASALLAVAAAASAELEQEQAERAVQTRQAALHLMGWNMAPLGAMARGRMDFDAERVAINAERLHALVSMMSDAFAPDTRGNAVTTEALDVIWEQPEAFAAKIRDSIAAAARLQSAAATGEEGAIREAIAGLGSTCGSCHDDFRADD